MSKQAFFKGLDEASDQYQALANSAAWDLARDPDNKELRIAFTKAYNLYSGQQQLRASVIELIHRYWPNEDPKS